MSLCCQVAEVTNERYKTIWRKWSLVRCYEAQRIWFLKHDFIPTRIENDE
jgi:hypothetical protein